MDGILFVSSCLRGGFFLILSCRLSSRRSQAEAPDTKGATPDMKTLFLDHVHRELGATFGEDFDFSLPQRYETPEREVGYVRDSAGLMDQSYRCVLELKGTGAGKVLNGVFSSAVSKLSPGEGQTSCLLTPKGRVIGAFFLHCIGDDAFRLATREPSRDQLVGGIRKYVSLSGIEVRDISSEAGTLLLQGPAAGKVLGELLDDTPLPRLRGPVLAVEIGSVRCSLTCGGATPEGGFKLWVPAGGLEEVWKSLHRATAAAGGGAVGHLASEELRVEAGQAAWSKDWDDDSFPAEIGWDHALTYNKCYVGQEIVARMRTYGEVNRRIRGLLVAGDRRVEPGSVVRVGDDEAGTITSCVRSTRLGRVLALARIKRKHWDASSVTVDAGTSGGRPLEARQVDLPFVRLDSSPASW